MQEFIRIMLLSLTKQSNKLNLKHRSCYRQSSATFIKIVRPFKVKQ